MYALAICIAKYVMPIKHFEIEIEIEIEIERESSEAVMLKMSS